MYIQKTVIFFTCCFSSFCLFVSICNYLGIKHLVCLANVSEWKLNESLQSFLSLTDHDFPEQEFYSGGGGRQEFIFVSASLKRIEHTHSILIATCDSDLLCVCVCVFTILLSQTNVIDSFIVFRFKTVAA